MFYFLFLFFVFFFFFFLLTLSVIITMSLWGTLNWLVAKMCFMNKLAFAAGCSYWIWSFQFVKSLGLLSLPSLYLPHLFCCILWAIPETSMWQEFCCCFHILSTIFTIFCYFAWNILLTLNLGEVLDTSFSKMLFVYKWKHGVHLVTI